ncbi:MAG TPA: cell wall hydrolase [Gammaproteobacteria bacterium]|nr:cell wall hydrolase [Gammaproteobacteria bacterium]
MILSTPLLCLAAAIYFEAGNQSVDGKYAVGQVVINRVKSPHFPGTVCGVVKQHKQFSFYWDGKPEKLPHNKLNRIQWEVSNVVAFSLLNAVVPDETNGALFYHTLGVSPNWSAKMRITTRIGRHVFY